MKRKIVSAIAAVFLLGILFCGCGEESYTPHEFAYYSYRSKVVFGNGITFAAAVRGGDEKRALDEMTELLTEMNSDMSPTLSSSALARFNSLDADAEYSDGYESERVEISADTYALVNKSVELCEDTDGAFDIAVYPLVKLWGVDADSLWGEHILPSVQEAEAVRSYCSSKYLRTYCEDGKFHIAKTHPKVQIDLGAIAKGYAADRCAEIARNCGAESALIDISGNICVMGEWFHPDERKYVPWKLGIVAPRPRGGNAGAVCAIAVSGERTLVTSGDYMRYYTADVGDEKLYVPHIVSAKSGIPLGVEITDDGYRNVSDRTVSVTVESRCSTEADAYATALCLMDRRDAIDFLQKKKLRGIIITEDGKMCLVGLTVSDFVNTDGEYAIDGFARYETEEYPID